MVALLTSEDGFYGVPVVACHWYKIRLHPLICSLSLTTSEAKFRGWLGSVTSLMLDLYAFVFHPAFSCLFSSLSDVQRRFLKNIFLKLTAMTMESIPTFNFNSTCSSKLVLGFNNDTSNFTNLCSQLAKCPGFCEAAFETGTLVSFSTTFISCY